MLSAIETNKNPRVLVIEDNQLLQMIHERELRLMGFDVTAVGDAQEAVNKWNEHWDLVFSDIGLPDIDGNQLCRMRREYEKENAIHTPAFAYSAYGSIIERDCLAAGFDKFGVKPMRYEDLYSVLQELLPNFRLIR